MNFPLTPQTLLARLKNPEDESLWQVSWKRFHQIYHEPVSMVARSCYRQHTGGQEPGSGFIEDAVADTFADFAGPSHKRYDPTRGRLQSFLRMLTNARVVDLLRKERPINHLRLDEADLPDVPEESDYERVAFSQSLLAMLIEDLRGQISMRPFEVFERVKIKHQSPDYVAEDFAITRAMVDRDIYKAMTKLREIVMRPEYQEELTD